MLNNLWFIIMLLLFIYTAVFTVYFCITVAAAVFIKPKRHDNPAQKLQYKNIIVAIYSHNNEKTIVNLVEQLNKQNYPEQNYRTHVILDNCTDGSANKLEFVGGAKLWRLTDDAPLGRDKATSWLLENLMSFEKVDAYVFLDATRNVKPDFLANVNDALQDNDVIVGSTQIMLEEADFYDCVWSNVNEYNTGIMKKGRANLNLAVPVDSNITVISSDVLKKVRCIDFKDANSELKYSLLLTSINCAPKFVPEVKTYVSSIDYTLRRPAFSYKLALIAKCLNLKALLNPKFTEFLFSLLKPNPLILAALIIALGIYSFNYYFPFDFPWAIVLATALVIAFGFSIYKSPIYTKNVIYLAFCPLFTLRDLLCEITPIKKLLKYIRKKQKFNTEKITVPVTVTNGRSLFSCYLDLISEDGFKKAVFRYKNKKQETNQSCVRMCDAVKNISDILEQHGFKMKICRSCAYFTPKIDGTNNMVKGYCNKGTVDETDSASAPETLLWFSCDYFVSQPSSNVIDITDYIKKS